MTRDWLLRVRDALDADICPRGMHQNDDRMWWMTLPGVGTLYGNYVQNRLWEEFE